jgi:hypothetical protein
MSPVLRLAYFRWALGREPLAFEWPEWRSSWRPSRPVNWEALGWLL